MDYIKQWCAEYDVPPDIEVHPDNPPHLPKDVLGQTWARTASDGHRYSVIDVQQCIPRDSMTYHALLWHEFCHAERWLKDGTKDQHNEAWHNRLWRRPVLAFWDTFVNPFTYPWYRRNLRLNPLS